MVNSVSVKYLGVEKPKIFNNWNSLAWKDDNLFYSFSSAPMSSIENVKSPIDYSKAKPDLNGEIDNYRQFKNDCWLLSGVSALANTTEGKRIIKSSVVNLKNLNKVVVNFKGVKQSITIPYDVIEAAKQSKNYVKGDDETLAIEIAAEHYKKLLIEKNKANEKMGPNIVNGKNVMGGKDNPLTGGYSSDIIYMLTGKSAKTIYTGNEKLNNQILNEIKEINKAPDEHVVTCNFRKRKNGLYVNHAYAVKSLDDKFVTLINPHDTSKEEKIPFDDFFSNLKSITVLELKTRSR